MGDTISTLLFQPPPPSKLKKHKVVWLTTSRGNKIPGFYISYKKQAPSSTCSSSSQPPHTQSSPPSSEQCKSLSADEIIHSQPEAGITLLYSHANAEDLGSIYPWCKFLSKMLQVNLFAYDYSGYGMALPDGTFVLVTFLIRWDART
jgi:abhydrolase domain-containing protein 17